MELVKEIISSHVIGLAALFINVGIIFLADLTILNSLLGIKKKEALPTVDRKAFCIKNKINEPRFWTDISKSSLVPLSLTYAYTFIKYIPNPGYKSLSLMVPLTLAIINEFCLRKYHSKWWFGTSHLLIWVFSGLALYFLK